MIRRLEPWLIFAAVAAILLTAHGNRLVFTNDEGIILEAAQRMTEGSRLYVDFFGYMSPGGYWLQEIAFRAFGYSLRSARLVVILDFAVQCALLFWITRRVSTRPAAWCATVLFFAFQASNPTLLTSAHRWDSAALALGAVTAALAGNRWLILSGALAASAAVVTPSVAGVAVVTFAWMATLRNWRGAFLFAGGAATAGLVAIAILAGGGIWGGFVDQMLWLQTHYSGVNVMPYGSIIGGYPALFEGASGLELAIRAALVLCVALPAVLPVIAAGGWGVRYLRRREVPPEIVYLLGCMAALVISCLPRADVMHLAFVAPLGYTLTAAIAALALSRRAQFLTAAGFSVFALVFLLNYHHEIRRDVSLDSPVGGLRIPQDAAPAVADLLRHVRAGDTLYVHPYLPLLYYITQARNPTRFSYLAPGMMGKAEEESALDSLRRNPPQWILYLALPREEFLRVFPSAGSLDNRFAALESWIETHYPLVVPPVTVAGYTLRARRDVSRTRR
ncbi:MAG: hypothetical protein K2X35_14820 [Bryobacteraceae bacterium]|nr:hypothetical protein [Bryobacteraceae bacterium]